MEGEISKKNEEKNEGDIFDIGEILDSSVSRVVGGTEDEQASVFWDFGEKMQGLRPKEFREAGKTYNVESFEREKTAEELEMTKAILDKVSEFMRYIGVEPINIKPERIHFLDAAKLQTGNIEQIHSFEPIEQYVIISDMGNNLANAQGIAHEVLHFNSFFSLQIDKDKIVRMRRSGISLKIKGGQELYFSEMNEAIITELEKMFEAKYFDSIPGIQQDLKKRQDYVTVFLQTHPDLKELLEDVAYTIYNPKTGLWDGGRYPYPKERGRLKKIIGDIYNSHKDSFKNEDEVFILFVRSVFGGGLLEITRVIDETYGKGSFRKLGRLTKVNIGNKIKK